MDISESAGFCWFNKETIPMGVNFLKLQCFLEMIGYSIPENKNASTIQHELARQLAFCVVSVKDAAEYTKVNTGTVLRWCSGSSAPSGGTKTLLEELIELHRNAADEKQKEWQNILKSLNLFNNQARTEEKAQENLQSQVSSKNETTLTHTQIIETLACLVLCAKPLAEQILSERFTPEERELLRKKTQIGRSSGIFDVSNLFSRLCSEQARKDMKR